MRTRKKFPTSGIYAVIGGISNGYFLNDADKRRFRYINPAGASLPTSWVGDCWIVDKEGVINPGTNCSPVPFTRESIGRRVAAT